MEEDALRIAALADGTRRALYEYVVAQPEAVGRERAALALGLAAHNVAFHLDRLVAEGLLVVEYRRLGNKTGPGAGRPSKLYRRSPREFTVSLPPRHYDLVGDILAGAVERNLNGEALEVALTQEARAHGRILAARAKSTPGSDPLDLLAGILAGQGYEPEITAKVARLRNCPFEALAQKHTALVCSLNRDFVQGICEGLGTRSITSCLEPEEGQCCVKARADSGLEHREALN